MILSHSFENLKYKNTWLSIGVFDGVHRGHQALIGKLVGGAHATGAPAVVLTFHPHPAIVLGGKMDFKSLSTPAERAELLGGLGVDIVINQEFDHTFARQTAEDFMRKIARDLDLRHLLIGYDFALGHNREGNAYRLIELGRLYGYTVDVVEPVWNNAHILSSTAIRSQIKDGLVSEAAASLGRWYSVTGPVVKGDGRGNKINYPTANIAYPPEKLLPANGIYVSWSWIGSQRYPSATNIGINPTFTPEKTTPNVETHLIGFNQDLYGQQVKVEFVARLRDELKFQSVEELVNQIKVDIQRSKEILTGM